MAISVVLDKVSEDETQVTYRYGPDFSTQGTVRLDLATGRFIDVEAPASASAAMEYAGAKHAIARAINAGKGFPDRLAYRA